MDPHDGVIAIQGFAGEAPDCLVTASSPMNHVLPIARHLCGPLLWKATRRNTAAR